MSEFLPGPPGQGSCTGCCGCLSWAGCCSALPWWHHIRPLLEQGRRPRQVWRIRHNDRHLLIWRRIKRPRQVRDESHSKRTWVQFSENTLFGLCLSIRRQHRSLPRLFNGYNLGAYSVYVICRIIYSRGVVIFDIYRTLWSRCSVIP